MDAVQRILDLIDKHNITAAQLQRDAKLSPSSIAQWKKGKSNPSYGALVKIANYFKVSVEYLEGKTDDPKIDEAKYLQKNHGGENYQAEKLTIYRDASLSVEEKYLIDVFRKGNVRDRVKMTNFALALDDEISGRMEDVE